MTTNGGHFTHPLRARVCVRACMCVHETKGEKEKAKEIRATIKAVIFWKAMYFERMYTEDVFCIDRVMF